MLFITGTPQSCAWRNATSAGLRHGRGDDSLTGSNFIGQADQSFTHTASPQGVLRCA